MTLIPPTRKRTRSCEEEEFLPLSKKINNLHINNWEKVNQPQEHILKWSNSPEQFINLCSNDSSNRREGRESRNSSPFKPAHENLHKCYNGTDLVNHLKHISYESYKTNSFSAEKYSNGENCCVNGNGSNRSNNDRLHDDWPRVYNPDLDVNENPYYYESNKLLFGLYIERLQRSGY